VRDSRRQPDWEAAVRHIKGTFPDLPADSDADWREIAEATYREGDDGRLRVDWDPALVKPLLAARVEDLDLWPLFGALRECPVVTIRGALSAVLGAETLARMKELLPNMTAVTIGEVGHAPSLAEPAATVAIDDLLARV
jgi:pimeloyl-ACP methyl ester carboxylesterase